MNPINLPFMQTMMCLVPDTPEQRLLLGKDALSVRTADGDMLFDRGRLELVRSLGGERVYNAAVRVLGLLQKDQPHLEGRGITSRWLGLFAANKDAFYERVCEELSDREASAATRMFSVATDLPGAKVARKVLVLAQGHWLEELLGVSVSSLQTIDGLHGGLRLMNGRLRSPLVEERVLATGITEDELAQMREAQTALHRMIDEGRMAEAAAAGGPTPLLVARAILWAEMTLVAAAARVELPEERWRLYQGPSLLELPPRGPERRERPEPTPAPTPAARPQPPTGTGPLPPSGTGPQAPTGTLPATGTLPTAGTLPAQPTGVSPRPEPTTGTATGAGTPPAAPGPSGSASAPAQPAAPHRAAVPPGTPMYAVPPGGTQPVPVLLLPDGTLAWGAAPTEGRIDAPLASAPRKARPRKTHR